MDRTLITKRLETIRRLVKVPPEFLSIFDEGERHVGCGWDGLELNPTNPDVVPQSSIWRGSKEVGPR